MINLNSFYINGSWQEASNLADEIDIINPATEQVIGLVALGNCNDVDDAVKAAKAAFNHFSKSSVEERLQWLEKILSIYESRYDDMVNAITLEMGAPVTLSKDEQAYAGIDHLQTTIKALRQFETIQEHQGYSLNYEPVGVCGLITPWNWPINQIVCKVAPAIAAGCTVILKPSEFSPLSAQIFAEIIDEAQLPEGVFNMVYGDGLGVGSAISQHPDIDMVSFTGSTKAGIAVAQAAAVSVKRVSQELGGKSPIILTEDFELETVVPDCVWLCMENTGQSCNAGTRLLVPEELHEQVVKIAVKTVESYVVGNPQDENVQIGPLANKGQFDKVTAILKRAEEQGMKPVIGGYSQINTTEKGYYVPPTIFANLQNNQTIANEEVFGPVLAILPYKSIEDAINIANDSDYGLSAYIYAQDKILAKQLATQLRVGMVHINGASLNGAAPFGGYKQSGNGREWGLHGVLEFMEVKAIME
jgi:aldehyde dehydrogenase (NAD+)